MMVDFRCNATIITPPTQQSVEATQRFMLIFLLTSLIFMISASASAAMWECGSKGDIEIACHSEGCERRDNFRSGSVIFDDLGEGFKLCLYSGCWDVAFLSRSREGLLSGHAIIADGFGTNYTVVFDFNMRLVTIVSGGPGVASVYFLSCRS